MSLIKANAVQIGQSPTATQNFTLAVPSSPDGTIKLARGNSGATTQDVISVDASGNVTANVSKSIVTTKYTNTPRALEERFRDDVTNILDWGAQGDGSSNDTTAINNAIAYGANAIYFPPGTYRTTSPIIIEKPVALIGAGQNISVIQADHTGNAIVFQPSTAGTSTAFLPSCKMSDMTVTRGPLGINSPQTNIWIRQCSGFQATGVTSNEGSVGFRITGGQLNSLIQCRAFAADVIPLPDNAGIMLEDAILTSGTQPCYTVNITDLFVGTWNKPIDTGIKVKSVDGLNISNAYFSFFKENHIWFNRGSLTSAISGVKINNVYFDCVDESGGGIIGTPQAILCSHLLPDGSYGAGDISVTNCVIANNDDRGDFNALIDFKRYGVHVSFTGCYIANSYCPWAVQLYDATVASSTGPSGKYIFTGNNFSLTSGATGGGVIYAKDVDELIINGNSFRYTYTTAYQILIDGTNSSVSTVGNITDGNPTETFVKIIGTVDSALILNAGQKGIGEIKQNSAEFRITSQDNITPKLSLNRPAGASYEFVDNGGLFEINYAGPGIDSPKTTSIRINPSVNLQLYEPSVEFRSITTTVNAANAFIDSAANNRIYRSSSSIQFKKDIESVNPSYSEKVLELQPVWYRSKCEADNSEWSYWGLIAEEVEKVDPRLVTYGYNHEDYETVEITKENGDVISEQVPKKDAVKKPMGVQYDRVPVLMLDILKKQQKQIEELSAKVEALESK